MIKYEDATGRVRWQPEDRNGWRAVHDLVRAWEPPVKYAPFPPWLTRSKRRALRIERRRNRQLNKLFGRVTP